MATSGWASQLGFTPNTVYRSGQASTLSAIQNNDVVYYSKSMRTVWAYTNKVSGVYQSASPLHPIPPLSRWPARLTALKRPLPPSRCPLWAIIRGQHRHPAARP